MCISSSYQVITNVDHFALCLHQKLILNNYVITESFRLVVLPEDVQQLPHSQSPNSNRIFLHVDDNSETTTSQENDKPDENSRLEEDSSEEKKSKEMLIAQSIHAYVHIDIHCS